MTLTILQIKASHALTTFKSYCNYICNYFAKYSRGSILCLCCITLVSYLTWVFFSKKGHSMRRACWKSTLRDVNSA